MPALIKPEETLFWNLRYLFYQGTSNKLKAGETHFPLLQKEKAYPLEILYKYSPVLMKS